MVLSGLKKVYLVRCENENWLAKAHQHTLSLSSQSQHESFILYLTPSMTYKMLHQTFYFLHNLITKHYTLLDQLKERFSKEKRKKKK
jgi:hypothetical protein